MNSTFPSPIVRRHCRTFFFWTHLIGGLLSGAIIAIVVFTGAVLAFEDEILSWVEPPPTISEAEAALVEPFHPSTSIARIEALNPGDRVTSLRFHQDPRRPYRVSFRDQATRDLHPGSFEVVESERGLLHEFFGFNLSLHRYLAAPRRTGDNPGWWDRDLGSNLVVTATSVFLFLCVSGLYLWWPRRLNWRSFRKLTRVRFDLGGLKRDWNWHNAFGFWALLPLAIMCLTGLAIASPSVRDVIYPGSKETPIEIAEPFPGAPAASPDLVFARIIAEVPDWTYMIFYLPRLNSDGTLIPRPLTVYTRRGTWPDEMYTALRFNPYTGELLRAPHWETLSITEALRALNDTLHTGAAFGLIGKAVAAAACLGGLILVYTGAALSWRRYRRFRARS